MKDKLFLLSAEETMFTWAFANSSDNKRTIRSCGQFFWLRSMRPNNEDSLVVSVIDPDGDVDRTCTFVAQGVRPCMHLANLEDLPRDAKNFVEFGTKFGSFRREKLKWCILDEETGWVIAKEAICNRKFNSSIRPCNFEKSELRQFLNTTLADALFSEEEKKRIVPVVLDGEAHHLA